MSRNNLTKTLSLSSCYLAGYYLKDQLNIPIRLCLKLNILLTQGY